MNILYIAAPSSIHDQKWIYYFSHQQNKHKAFLVYERQLPINDDTKQNLEQNNTRLLPPIHSFSLVRPLQSLRAILTLKKYIKTYNIDLVHILFATPHAFWGNFISIPYCITTRGSDVLVVIPSLLNTKGIKKLHNSLLFKLLKKAFLKANNINATSLGQITQIQQLFDTNKEVSLIRTGVDVDSIANLDWQKYLPKSLLNKVYIFCPRYLQPIYNNELIIEAVSLLPEEVKKNIELVLIRGKKNVPEYQKKIDTLLSKVGVKYTLFDFLSQQEIWACYHGAKITIMTPHSDGTPNSALEAMAAKCPLILGNLPYDKDLFEDSCLKTANSSPKELASLTFESLTNYPSELINEGFNRVKSLGNRAVEMQKLEDIYYDL